MTLTVGSLFSGVGGFDLGFERAGMNVRWQCEIDKAARGVLRRHWPEVTLYEDVRNVGNETASVDVVMGGFPCQDVSVAGRRAGLAGERSGLWFEFARVLSDVVPQWVVVENVPGLLTSNGGDDFAVILYGLVERGYRCAWRVLDSQCFGVPQRRRRLFIVGHLGDGRAAQVLFECESMPGHSDQGKPAIFSTADQINRHASRSSGVVFDARGNGNGLTISTLTGDHMNRITDYTPVLLTDDGLRRLTPLECERLQGFPDGWTAGQSDSARYKQMGNAVTVNVAEWIGRRIVEGNHDAV